MKKLLLIAALLFASFGAFADDFDTFVEAMKTENSVVIRADKPHRIIFIDTKLSDDIVSLSDEEIAEIKKELFKAAKGDDPSVVKDLNVTIISNFITKDGKIYSVVISSGDL